MIWWIPIVAALPAQLLWTIFHEGAHALAVIISGGELIDFQPWPHERDGEFFFGRTVFVGGSLTFIRVAPYLADALAFALFMIVFFLLRDNVSRSVLAVLLACPAFNTAAAVVSRIISREVSDLVDVHWAYSLLFGFLLLSYVALWGYSMLHWRVGGD